MKEVGGVDDIMEWSVLKALFNCKYVRLEQKQYRSTIESMKIE